MKKLIFLGLFVAAVANPWTLAWIARHYVVADDLDSADAVVPLRGSADEERLRLEEAARLVREGLAPVLLVSADGRPFYGHPNSKLVAEYLEARQFPTDKLRFCENTADFTREEAQALLLCLRAMDAKQVIIVTSEYHTRRTRFLFRHTFASSGIQVKVHPMYHPKYWNPRWWRQRRWTKTFVIETLSLVWNAAEIWTSSLRGVPIPTAAPASPEPPSPD